jgi:hypothetical protein
LRAGHYGSASSRYKIHSKLIAGRARPMLIGEERLFPCVTGQLFGLDEDEVAGRIEDIVVLLLGFQALSRYVAKQIKYLYSNSTGKVP